MADPDDKAARYAPGNEAEDGGYVVGKFKPPEAGKFRKGDGRPRGRRLKGTKNLRTDFAEEMASPVTVTINGSARKVSRQRAIVMRLADNATRGQNAAIQTVLRWQDKLEDTQAEAVRSDNAAKGDAEHDNNMPGLDSLTPEEFSELDRLLHKAHGLDYQPKIDPLAYMFDPSDKRIYGTEGTVEGLRYRHCTIPGVKSELIGVENYAYRKTALPKRTTFDRRRY